MTVPSVAQLSDEQLLAKIKTLADDERHATAALVALLAELDARRLYLRESCSSLFTYCTQVLYLSEHAAYGRIEAAHAARRFPVILDLLADGSLTLTSVCLLAPHLTPDNHQDVLAAAPHKSKREVELLVASLRPQQPVPSSVRKVPVPRPAEARSAHARRDDDTLLVPLVDAAGGNTHVDTPVTVPPPPNRPAVIAPLAPDRYKVQFTVSRATYERLCRAQDPMRHRVPNGDPGLIFDRALTLLVAELEKTKFGATVRPRAPRPTVVDSRYIPANVKRNVWQRDGGQCAFVGTNGRCAERGFLEFHDRPDVVRNSTLLSVQAREFRACIGHLDRDLLPSPTVEEVVEIGVRLDHHRGVVAEREVAFNCFVIG
jgi:hypothetical protein